MGFFKRFRRASKVALYVGVGPKVASAASTFAIVDGLGGGAPAARGSDDASTAQGAQDGDAE
jgi:hypothetical protein